jgi:predicted nucleic acid-binding protein
MLVLADSNVLLRLFHQSDPLHSVVRSAIHTLRARGDRLCYTSQVLGEFWNVCTRPVTARGGFGLTVAETDRRVRRLERRFTLLPDTPLVHQQWHGLLLSHSVTGVQVHDTRLVAAMTVYGLTQLLTFNVGDFGRYFGITALHPQEV